MSGTGSSSPALTIAIDGPSGAGKSTVSKEIARRLGGIYVDTGAMYRDLTLALLSAGVEVSNSDEVARLCTEHDISLSVDPEHAWVRVDGVDVTAAIRSDQVTSAVSAVSAVPQVRGRLVDEQRRLRDQAVGRGQSVVMEGRDIASVVLPDATLKIWLTADVSARAARRAAEVGADAAASLTKISVRDAQDSSRTLSPAVPPAQAHVIDATDLSVEEVVAAIWALLP